VSLRLLKMTPNFVTSSLRYRSIFDLRSATFKCTLYLLPDLYSEDARGELFSGQHPNCLHILFCSSGELDANRFLLGWLFLHHRLRSRQRGSFACAPERLLLLSGGSLPKSVSRFYPGNLKKSFNSFSASLSASIQGVNSNFFPSFVTLKRCVTASVSLPWTGQNPVGVFDYEWILHPFLLMSSRKYLRF